MGNAPHIFTIIGRLLSTPFRKQRSPADDAEPIGTVTMQPDRTLVAQLRAEGPNGIVGDARYVLAPPDPAYQRMIDHVGGLEPGQTKPVKPWNEQSK